MRRLGGASVAVVLTATALAGCSSGTTTTGTTSAPPTTAATASAGTSKAPGTTAAKPSTTKGSTGTTGTTAGGPEQTKALAALLVASDLPGTWKADDPTTNGTASSNQTFLAQAPCKSLVGSPDVDVPASPQVQVSFMQDDTGLNVQNELDVYPSPDAAGTLVGILQNQAFGPCLSAVISASGGKSAPTGSQIEVAELSMPSAADLGVDAAAARQVTITTAPGPTQLVLNARFYAMQKGDTLDAVTLVITSQPGATAPDVDMTSAVQAAAKKLSAAY